VVGSAGKDQRQREVELQGSLRSCADGAYGKWVRFYGGFLANSLGAKIKEGFVEA